MTSKVWNEFVLDEKEIFAKCKHCEQRYKYSKTTGTSNMIRHLKCKHGINIVETDNIQDIAGGEKKVLSAETKKNLDNLYIKFIVSDFQPFNISGNKHFTDFIEGLNPNYAVPNRKQAREQVKNMYENEIIKRIQLIADSNTKFSISFDTWTSVANDQYLGIKIHYVSNFCLNCFTLSFQKIENQMAETIIKNINDTFTKFKLNFDKLLAITSDNCNVMLAVYNLLLTNNKDLIFVGCVAHKINLISKEIINSENIIQARSLANFIKKSPKIINLLEQIAINEKQTYYTVKNDVPTRWNSTYIMLDSLIKNESIIKKLTDTNILSNEIWLDLKKCLQQLKPFYDITMLISGSNYCTIGILFSVIRLIKIFLDQFKDSKKYTVLIQKFDKYFGNLNEDIFIGMILDPRFKMKLFDQAQNIKYMNKFKLIYEAYKLKYHNTLDINKTTKTDQNNTLKYINNINIFPEDILNDELVNYLNSPLAAQEINILEWWKVNSCIYQVLSLIAVDFLSIPITSVPVEQLFSQAGITITQKRNRLKSDIIENIMCLHNWIDS